MLSFLIITKLFPRPLRQRPRCPCRPSVLPHALVPAIFQGAFMGALANTPRKDVRKVAGEVCWQAGDISCSWTLIRQNLPILVD